MTLHNYNALHYITLHGVTLHHISLHGLTLHYITLHYITLHGVTLHHISLHGLTLHYITLHTYINIQLYTCFHPINSVFLVLVRHLASCHLAMWKTCHLQIMFLGNPRVDRPSCSGFGPPMVPFAGAYGRSWGPADVSRMTSWFEWFVMKNHCLFNFIQGLLRTLESPWSLEWFEGNLQDAMCFSLKGEERLDLN